MKSNNISSRFLCTGLTQTGTKLGRKINLHGRKTDFLVHSLYKIYNLLIKQISALLLMKQKKLLTLTDFSISFKTDNLV